MRAWARRTMLLSGSTRLTSSALFNCNGSSWNQGGTASAQTDVSRTSCAVSACLRREDHLVPKSKSPPAAAGERWLDLAAVYSHAPGRKATLCYLVEVQKPCKL